MLIITIFLVVCCTSVEILAECNATFGDKINFRLFSSKDLSWYTVPEKELTNRLQDQFITHNYYYWKHRNKTVILFPDRGELPCSVNSSSYLIAEALYDKDKEVYRDEVNVMIIDYYQIFQSRNELKYHKIVAFVPPVGECVGKAIKDFVDKIKRYEQLHFIGVGFGAQVMSYAAKTYGKGKVRITGLDPALRSFKKPGQYLISDDGSYVDIIHTDSCKYGYCREIGHSDFFPNFGVRPQPPCKGTYHTVDCSHQMAWKYYVETILHKDSFRAVKCASGFICYEGAETSNCTCQEFGHEYANMGYWVSLNTKGGFYLRTASTPPYYITGEILPRASKTTKIAATSLVVCILLYLC